MYGIPASELLFGTVSAQPHPRAIFEYLCLRCQDWPYRPPFEYPGDIEAIVDAAFITAADKMRIFRSNAEVLHGMGF